ncbi:MAG: hypothetical protein QM709_05255 [Spongiibacteraceae bacterium]
MDHRLPKEYAALERFVDTWSLPDRAARSLQRAHSTTEERAEFYNTTKEYVATALDVLDQKPLHALNAQEQCLLNLLLSFAHVSLAVEIQGNAESQHAISREALQFC